MTTTILAAMRTIARAIDVEGAFLGAGILGLTFVAWQLDPLLGVGVASVAAVALGLILTPASEETRS